MRFTLPRSGGWRSSRVLWAGLLGIAWLSSGWFAGPGTAQDPGSNRSQTVDQAGNATAATPLPTIYFGTVGCGSAGCHEKGQTATPSLVCRCDELDRWKAHDRHALAFAALRTELGRRMLRTLYKTEDPHSKQAEACVACHGVVAQPSQKHATFDPNEGVNCVVCHGPHKEWIGEHSLVISRGEFAKLDRKTKESRYGMVDLWDPVTRARLCASCHIGNDEQGKFITHEMYAAGHPPLPSFELTQFTERMPRHWELLRDKKPEIQKRQGYNSALWEQTEMMLVGAAIGQAESMKLVQAQAKKARESGEWLDWANFDCYSCHHELKLPSWRQDRGYVGRPGRIPMKQWPTVLAWLAAETTDGSATSSWDKTRGPVAANELAKAFVERPFGNPQAIETQAATLAKWSDALALRIREQKPGADWARRILRQGPDLLEKSANDFDSARQAAWALRMIRLEEKEILKDQRPDWDRMLGELGSELGLGPAVGPVGSPNDPVPSHLSDLNRFDPARLREWIARARLAWK